MHGDGPMISECLEELGDDRFRCRNHGIEFTATVFPITCCSTSPNATEGPVNVRERMLAELEAAHAGVDLARVTEQLDQCLTPCKRFNGRSCTRQGSECKVWKRWTEFLACSTERCKHFEPTA